MSHGRTNPTCRGDMTLGTGCGQCVRCVAESSDSAGESNVTRLRHALQLSHDITKTLTELDSAITKAIDTANAAGLPQGLIVAELHGHAHAQTHNMVSK